MNKLRVGVIGCGLIGQRRAKTALESPDSALAFVVDNNADAAMAAAEKFHCLWETDWTRVTRNKEVDVIVVSTPNHLLAPIACEALKAGKHVLIEKPMGLNFAEAQKMQKKREDEIKQAEANKPVVNMQGMAEGGTAGGQANISSVASAG